MTMSELIKCPEDDFVEMTYDDSTADGAGRARLTSKDT